MEDLTKCYQQNFRSLIQNSILYGNNLTIEKLTNSCERNKKGTIAIVEKKCLILGDKGSL